MHRELLRRSMCVEIPGSTIKAYVTCQDIPVEIQGAQFSANLIVLGTEGIDVVLGLGWMSKYH